MQEDTPYTHPLRVADLPTRKETRFVIEPDADAREAIAAELDLSALRKLRFEGSLAPKGKSDWRLQAKLGATVVQPCVVTLDPVTTRIDETIERKFLSDPDAAQSGNEDEMQADDRIEALGETIDPARVMIEALALALPDYPRSEGAALGEAVFTEPGSEPMRDEDTKPFAGLAGLRDKLKKDQ